MEVKEEGIEAIKSPVVNALVQWLVSMHPRVNGMQITNVEWGPSTLEGKAFLSFSFENGELFQIISFDLNDLKNKQAIDQTVIDRFLGKIKEIILQKIKVWEAKDDTQTR